MPDERYPSDAQLLSLSQDNATGVDYIPTGRSPYVLDYRRSLHRTLRAAERANDLRVYIDGDLSIGVRAGRCFINGSPVNFTGDTGISLAANSTLQIWLDPDGLIQMSTNGLPADRSTFIPLAEVVTGSNGITQLTDLRGEAFLQAPNAAALGLTADAADINRALDGVNPSVSALALNQLTAGFDAPADFFHTHINLIQNIPEEAIFTLVNDSEDDAADVSLSFSALGRPFFDTVLRPHPTHRFLQQQHDNISQTLVGSTTVSHIHAGELVSSIVDRAMGVVPLDGQIVAVMLSLGQNLQSSASDDGLSVAVKVNGAFVTDTLASVTSTDGPGFVSTDQGEGVAATIQTDGSAIVSRGDLLSFDLTRTASGTVNNEASDVGILVVVRADRPE